MASCCNVDPILPTFAYSNNCLWSAKFLILFGSFNFLFHAIFGLPRCLVFKDDHSFTHLRPPIIWHVLKGYPQGHPHNNLIPFCLLVFFIPDHSFLWKPTATFPKIHYHSLALGSIFALISHVFLSLGTRTLIFVHDIITCVNGYRSLINKICINIRVERL